MTSAATQELLEIGLERHRGGDLAGAQTAYRRILEQDAHHHQALHLLGVAAFQAGNRSAALDLIHQSISIRPAAEAYANLGMVLTADEKPQQAIAAYLQAIALHPNFPEAHCNLGLAYFAAGQFEQAAASYRQALVLRPEFAEAWNNLANALHAAAKFEEALAAFRKAIELYPAYPQALSNLGNTLKALGRLDEALAAYQQALAIDPAFPEAHNNVGLIRHERGRYADAIRSYQSALAARPDFADAHYNLAICLREAGDIRGALNACREAVSLRPGWPEALNNLGICLHATGDPQQAAAAFRQAIAARASYAEAHNNLANALNQLGRNREAITHYRKAVTIRPDYAEAHSNLGNALKQAGRSEEAIASLTRALELNPKLAAAQNNLGNIYKDQGELDEAIACYERAAALAPYDASIDSNRIYTLYFHPEYTPGEILREHLRWDQRHTRSLGAWPPHDNDPSPDRRLRIGYVSPDFRDHCQSMFTIPLLSNHDRRACEVFCYGDVESPDAVTARIRNYADTWRTITGLSDQQVADIIRRDKIDILVDLTAHMSRNRMLVFARKPAPVQVTWLAYPGTTGLRAMDYRLSDPYLDPSGEDARPGPHDRFYAERTLRLPETFWCYDPLANDLPLSTLPARANGCVTFGCLNNFCKVNDRTLELWSTVLQAVPRSRLILLVPRGSARERVLTKFQEQGIEPTRVEFTDRLPRREYLSLYQRIDVALDTFPYNGHTTTLDALWMGVPVVTLAGRTAVGRGGWSQLSNLAVRELAARSEKQFTRIAADLALDLDRLSRLRFALRDRLRKSPLMDAPRFARNMESAFRTMWTEWATHPGRMPMSA